MNWEVMGNEKKNWPRDSDSEPRHRILVHFSTTVLFIVAIVNNGVIDNNVNFVPAMTTVDTRYFYESGVSARIF